jgi:hypothetical protein
MKNLILILCLFSFSAWAKKDCLLKGDVVLWKYAYCQTVAETHDCESEAVSSCVAKQVQDKKESDCSYKMSLQIKMCKEVHKNQASKEYQACLKELPSIIKNGGCT